MNSSTAAHLIELNKDFYTRFGDSFSATRHRIQPGVRRVLQMLKGDESILDLGCGNGELARELAKRGHRGPYLGVDFSLQLLRDAEPQPEGFSARFLQVDLTSDNLIDVIASRVTGKQHLRSPALAPGASVRQVQVSPGNDIFGVIYCFAVLHHIPSHKLRLKILEQVHKVLRPDGKFIHSNWQFLNSEKLKARIQPWEAGAISESDVDSGDYLLDWRDGGLGLRYIHHFSEVELNELAEASGFHVSETYHADGEGGRLGLYQVWMPVSDKNM